MGWKTNLKATFEYETFTVELCRPSYFSRDYFLIDLDWLISEERWVTLKNKVPHTSPLINSQILLTADISYANTPNAHQSTALLYPFDKIISGARYSV